MLSAEAISSECALKDKFGLSQPSALRKCQKQEEALNSLAAMGEVIFELQADFRRSLTLQVVVQLGEKLITAHHGLALPSGPRRTDVRL